MSSESPANDAAKSGAPSSTDSPVSQCGFSLATMLLVVTIVSIVCGLAAIAPGLGLAAAIIAAPALARTAIVARHHPAPNSIDKLVGKISLFAGSVLFTTVFGVAAGVCCYATCWAGFFAGAFVGQLWERGAYRGLGTGLVVGFGTGGIVASVLAYMAMTRIGLPFPSKRIALGEKSVAIGVIILAVVGGFFLFFGMGSIF
jgi:hypothetical protein